MTDNTKTHLHSAEMQCRWCRNTFANLVAQCWTPLSELLLKSEDSTQELEPKNTEWVSQFLTGCIVWDYWCIFTLGLGSFLRLLVYHTGAQCWKSFRIAAWKWNYTQELELENKQSVSQSLAGCIVWGLIKWILLVWVILWLLVLSHRCTNSQLASMLLCLLWCHQYSLWQQLTSFENPYWEFMKHIVIMKKKIYQYSRITQ